MAENVPNLVKDLAINMQEAQPTTCKMNSKTSLTHTLNFQKTKSKP